MSDYAHKESDKILQEMEERIRDEYQRNLEAMRERLDKFLADYNEENEGWKKRVSEGTATEEEYKNWLKKKAFEKKRIQSFISNLVRDLKRTTEIAYLIIGDHMPEVFEVNANWSAYDIEMQTSGAVSFELFDEEMSRQAIEADRQRKRTEIVLKGDRTRNRIDSWNYSRMQNEVVQGLMNGESNQEIAQRLERVLGMTETSAIRNARTMTTAMESAGKMMTYRRAKAMGIDIIRVWIATLDDRTRHWHAELDGQRREIDEPFEVDGYEIDYPGDPYAEPFLVYNCRCAMMSQIRDMQWDENEIRTVSEEFEDYDDWKQRKGLNHG